jgi:hypothetical protein
MPPHQCVQYGQLQRTWVAQSTQRLRCQSHIRIVYADACFPRDLFIVRAPHTGSIHGAAHVFRHARYAVRYPGECRAVQRRQMPPLRGIKVRPWTQFYRVAWGMTCRPSSVWQVQRLDARQPAIARCRERIVCRDRGKMERLGLVLRVGRRWWALLFLLHDADVVESARARSLEIEPHVSVLRCSDPVMHVAAPPNVCLDVRNARRARYRTQCGVGGGCSMR